MKICHKQLMKNWPFRSWCKTALQRHLCIHGMLATFSCSIATRKGLMKEGIVALLKVKEGNFNHWKILKIACQDKNCLRSSSFKDCEESMEDEMRSSFCKVDTVTRLPLLKHIEEVPDICFSYYISGAFTFFRFMLETRIIYLCPEFLPNLSKRGASFQTHTQQAWSLLLQPSYCYLKTRTRTTEVFGKSLLQKNISLHSNPMTKITFKKKIRKLYYFAVGYWYGNPTFTMVDRTWNITSRKRPVFQTFHRQDMEEFMRKARTGRDEICVSRLQQSAFSEWKHIWS